MKNYELNHFLPDPICDVHMHCHVQLPLDRSVEIYRTVMEHMNYERVALQTLPTYSLCDTFEGLYYKSRISGVYADAGLFHYHDERDTPEYYLEYAKTCYAMGCDGFKIIEGKPDSRKEFGKQLDDPSLDKFYAFAEEKVLPVLMHLADPRYYWDPAQWTDYMIKVGWNYDDSFVSFEGLMSEMEGILNKFPKLHLIIAHFGFVADDLDYARSLMSRYENLCFDLTPGSSMFKHFNKRSDEWKQFFIEHADRILFGTDIYNWPLDGQTPEGRYGRAVNLVRGFLESREPFYAGWFKETLEHPFGLDDDVLDKIYRDNFIRLYGAAPRELDKELIVAEAQKWMQAHELTDLQRANMQQIITEFSR